MISIFSFLLAPFKLIGYWPLKQAEQKEGMDTYATCTLDVFDKAQKIADLIDSIRQQHKTEAGVLLSIARGESTKDSLKEITPEISKQIDELTSLVGGLK